MTDKAPDCSAALRQARFRRQSGEMRLRSHWLLFVGLSVLTAFGAVGFNYFSHDSEASLQLLPGETARVTVLRPAPHELKAELWFAREPGRARPDLGDYVYSSRSPLKFANPGSLVLVKVAVRESEVLHTALPAGAFGSDRIGRTLTQTAPGLAPGEFVYPPLQPQIIPFGRSDIVFTVLQAGPDLLGEQVKVRLDAPVQFKRPSEYNYAWLGLFTGWPLFGLALFVYGATLIWRTLRPSSDEALERGRER